MADIKGILDTGVQIAGVFNSAAPGIASVIAIIRGTDGKITVMPILDSAEEGFEATILKAKQWQKDHPKGSS